MLLQPDLSQHPILRSAKYWSKQRRRLDLPESLPARDLPRYTAARSTMPRIEGVAPLEFWEKRNDRTSTYPHDLAHHIGRRRGGRAHGHRKRRHGFRADHQDRPDQQLFRISRP